MSGIPVFQYGFISYKFVLEHIAVAHVSLPFSIFSVFFYLDKEVLVTL